MSLVFVLPLRLSGLGEGASSRGLLPVRDVDLAGVPTIFNLFRIQVFEYSSVPCRTYTPGSPGAQWKRLRSKSGLGVMDRQSESPARPAVPSLLPSSVPGSSLSHGAERLAECASVAAQANTLTNCYHRRRCSSSLSKWTLPLRSLLVPSREPLGMGLGEPAIRFPLQVASLLCPTGSSLSTATACKYKTRCRTTSTTAYQTSRH